MGFALKVILLILFDAVVSWAELTEPQKQSISEKLRHHGTFASLSDIEALQNFKIVIIADNSFSMVKSSMANGDGLGGSSVNRWRWLANYLQEAGDLLLSVVDTFDLVFLKGSFEAETELNMYTMSRGAEKNGIIGTKITEPTNEGTSIADIFSNIRDLRETPLTGTVQRWMQDHRGKHNKPVLMIIVTDGAPTDWHRNFQGQTAEQVFEATMLQYIRSEDVALSLVSCGPEEATSWMSVFNETEGQGENRIRMDVTMPFEREKARIDEVGKFPKNFEFRFGDWIVKTLLGPVLAWWDCLNQKCTTWVSEEYLFENILWANYEDSNRQYYQSVKVKKPASLEGLLGALEKDVKFFRIWTEDLLDAKDGDITEGKKVIVDKSIGLKLHRKSDSGVDEAYLPTGINAKQVIIYAVETYPEHFPDDNVKYKVTRFTNGICTDTLFLTNYSDMNALCISADDANPPIDLDQEHTLYSSANGGVEGKEECTVKFAHRMTKSYLQHLIYDTTKCNTFSNIAWNNFVFCTYDDKIGDEILAGELQDYKKIAVVEKFCPGADIPPPDIELPTKDIRVVAGAGADTIMLAIPENHGAAQCKIAWKDELEARKKKGENVANLEDLFLYPKACDAEGVEPDLVDSDLTSPPITIYACEFQGVTDWMRLMHVKVTKGSQDKDRDVNIIKVNANPWNVKDAFSSAMNDEEELPNNSKEWYTSNMKLLNTNPDGSCPDVDENQHVAEKDVVSTEKFDTIKTLCIYVPKLPEEEVLKKWVIYRSTPDKIEHSISSEEEGRQILEPILVITGTVVIILLVYGIVIWFKRDRALTPEEVEILHVHKQKTLLALNP